MRVGLRADIVRPHRRDLQKATSDEHLLIILCKQTIWGAFRVIQGPVGRGKTFTPAFPAVRELYIDLLWATHQMSTDIDELDVEYLFDRNK